MKFQRTLERLYHRPWFISPGGYAAIEAVVNSATAEELAEGPDFSDFVQTRREMEVGADGIARIHVLGALGRNLSPIEQSCGNTSYESISAELGDAVAAGVKGIIFDIDSPGGMASGAGELAAEIAEVSQFIPTATVVSDMCASAAYYLASGTGAIFAEPSATIGSVGVIIPWVDSSKSWELVGLEFDPITNAGADLKGTMHGPSLTDEQRGYLQDTVNDLAEQFHSHVATHREVTPEVFRAGAYVGGRAQAMGLSDWAGGMEEATAWVLNQ